MSTTTRINIINKHKFHKTLFFQQIAQNILESVPLFELSVALRVYGLKTLLKIVVGTVGTTRSTRLLPDITSKLNLKNFEHLSKVIAITL